MVSAPSYEIEGAALRRLAGAFDLSAQTLARDPSQLAGQLVGRLPASEDDALAPTQRAARAWRGAAWLRPLAPTLTPPGGALARLLTGHEGTPRSVTVSPDGLVAASAGNSSPDRTIHIWDVRRGGPALQVLSDQAEAGGRTPIALTGDGSTLLTGYGDELRAFDVATGTGGPLLARPGSRITALAAASAAAVCVAAWGDGALTVCVPEPRSTRNLPRRGEAVLALSLSADGTVAAAGTARELEVIDLEGGHVIARHTCETGLDRQFPEIPALTLSEDLGRVYHGAPPRAWRIHEDRVDEYAGTGTLRVLAVSPGGRALCASEPGGLVVVELGGAAEPRELPQHASQFSAAAVTPDGAHAVCADLAHAVTVWRLDAPTAPAGDSGAAVRTAMRDWAGDALQRADRDSGAERWARSPDGAVAIGATWNRMTKVSEAQEPLERAGLERIPLRRAGGAVEWLTGHTRAVVAVAITSDGRLGLSAGFGRIVRVWDLARAEQLHALRGHAGIVWDAATVPGRPWGVTASEDRTIVLWDLAAGTRLATFTGDDAMTRCAVDPAGEHIVAGDDGGAVHILRIELPRPADHQLASGPASSTR